MVRNATSAATISASGVEWETQVCRLDCPCSGNLVSGPSRQRYTREVERAVLVHPAKSASA